MIKRVILTGAIVFATFNSYAGMIVKEGYRIDDPAKQFLPQLKLRKDFSFDQINSHGYTIYGPEGLGQWLEMNNISGVDVTFHDDDKAAPSGFLSHEDLGKLLLSYQTRFPKLAKIESIGKSVQGRDLWAIKISKNVDADEIEPEFKYIANMHGDEITGREVTMRFIGDILENYGKDDRITKLIDNTEIYIIPTMNPDGMTAHRRGNFNYTDLNRDFPDFPNNPNGNIPEGRAPETQAIMRFQAQHHFSLSANFHGGAVVVNYPWDTLKELHPLNDLIVDFSKEYASTNPEMKNSHEFTDGITNGYAWYELNGGMQDWSTFWYNDLQVTLEISEIKWIDPKTIDNYYKENRESMLNYMTRVHQGAGFNLQDKEAKGKVKVVDSSGKNLGEFNFFGGEFYKVLDPGNYTFEVTIGRLLKIINVTVYKNEILPHGNYIVVEN